MCILWNQYVQLISGVYAYILIKYHLVWSYAMTVEFTATFVRLAGNSPVMQALAGGLITALLNLVGASLVLVWRNSSERALDSTLGFAAGIMIAAAFTSPIISGIEAYSGGTPIPTLIGVGIGALFLDCADALVAHALSSDRRTTKGQRDRTRRFRSLTSDWPA